MHISMLYPAISGYTLSGYTWIIIVIAASPPYKSSYVMLHNHHVSSIYLGKKASEFKIQV